MSSELWEIRRLIRAEMAAIRESVTRLSEYYLTRKDVHNESLSDDNKLATMKDLTQAAGLETLIAAAISQYFDDVDIGKFLNDMTTDTLTGANPTKIPTVAAVKPLADDIQNLETTTTSMTSSISNLTGDVQSLESTTSGMTTTINNLSSKVEAIPPVADALTTSSYRDNPAKLLTTHLLNYPREEDTDIRLLITTDKMGTSDDIPYNTRKLLTGAHVRVGTNTDKCTKVIGETCMIETANSSKLLTTGCLDVYNNQVKPVISTTARMKMVGDGNSDDNYYPSVHYVDSMISKIPVSSSTTSSEPFIVSLPDGFKTSDGSMEFSGFTDDDMTCHLTKASGSFILPYAVTRNDGKTYRVSGISSVTGELSFTNFQAPFIRNGEISGSGSIFFKHSCDLSNFTSFADETTLKYDGFSALTRMTITVPANWVCKKASFAASRMYNIRMVASPGAARVHEKIVTDVEAGEPIKLGNLYMDLTLALTPGGDKALRHWYGFDDSYDILSTAYVV